MALPDLDLVTKDKESKLLKESKDKESKLLKESKEVAADKELLLWTTEDASPLVVFLEECPRRNTTASGL